MMGLTERQAECLAIIHAFIAAERRAPSVRELSAHLGAKSTSTAHRLLVGLKRRGYVDWTPRLSGSIELKEKAPRTFVLPEHVYAQLQRHCMSTAEDPSAVVADAVALHLDEIEADGPAEAAVM